MNKTDSPTPASGRSATVVVQKKLIFFIGSLIAVLGFVAGTRIDEINASLTGLTNQTGSSSSIDLSSVEKTYRHLVHNYDGTIDTQRLTDGANKGLVKALGDKYTVYLTAKEAKELEGDLNGDIGGGIGAEIGLRDDKPTIVRVLENNPAQRAGLQKNDRILKVNNEDVRNKSVDETVGKIRGEEGTTVELTVERNGNTQQFTITRAVVDNPSVRTEIKDGIGILTISRFDSETGSLTKKAAQSFKDKNVNKIILDLRGDGGGYIDGAIDVASLWISDGVIVSQKKNGRVVDTASARGEALLDGKSTVVLVDEGTASASEIVAGALRDYKKATLVGKRTFGKGSVQQLIGLEGGAQLKVTIAKWYTPKGHNINGNGLIPDMVVDLSAKDINSGQDPQLDAAIRRLK